MNGFHDDTHIIYETTIPAEDLIEYRSKVTFEGAKVQVRDDGNKYIYITFDGLETLWEEYQKYKQMQEIATKA